MRMIAAVCAVCAVCVFAVSSSRAHPKEEKPAAPKGGERRTAEGGTPEKMTPAEQATKMFEHIDKDLELTADQKAKIKPEIEKGVAEHHELMEKLEKSDRERSERIRALLTDEQKEKYDMMRARQKMMRHRMHEHMMGAGRGGGRGMGDHESKDERHHGEAGEHAGENHDEDDRR